MAHIPKQYSAAQLAQKIEQARQPDATRVTFDGYEIELVQAVLRGCAQLHPDVSPHDRRGIVWSAIVKAAENPTISGDNLVAALSQAEADYLRKRPTNWVISTYISLPRFQPPIRRRIERCSALITSALPDRFDEKTVQEQVTRFAVIDLSQWSRLRISVAARTHAAAVSKAQDAFDIVRATWNLRLNLASVTRDSWPRSPVNDIRIGPVYVLHRPDGSIAHTSVWYDPPHYQYEKLRRISTPWSELKTLELWIRKRLKRVAYGEQLTDLMRRYTRSLDTSDYELAFGKLWSVLEHLTAAVGTDYAAIVRRASFLYRDHEYARTQLCHLRDRRSGLVHHDRVNSMMEPDLFLLKQFVEQVLLFHLRSDLRFRSVQEAAEYLDLPLDPKVLKRRAALATRAAVFRS